MKIRKPTVAIIDDINGDEILKKLEVCGRVCYKSEDRITDDSANDFVAMLIKLGHESVLEHVSVSVRFICDRGVSHEIVRHRIASYSQESTRYCNYGDDDIEFIVPSVPLSPMGKEAFISACDCAEESYSAILNEGGTPQQARAVLPNALKTELIMTANLREWRHFFKLRCSPKSHPDMRYLANMLLAEFAEKIPVVFEDLK